MINPLFLLLEFCAKNGRWILVASLVVGIASETLAELIKPHIDILIALLLFMACLRVGTKQALGAIGQLTASLTFVVILQVLMPLLLAFLALYFEIRHPLVFALIMLWAAPSLSGSPHLVVLMGFDPAPALRQLVIGTALLPLTIIPVFLLLPEFGDIAAVAQATIRLFIVIAIAATIAFLIRAIFLKNLSDNAISYIDGTSTLLLAITVVGLMTAIRSASYYDVAITLAVAFIANIGMQVLAALILAKSSLPQYSVPIGIIAGNRNIALFLAALPAATVEPLLLFIGCYQIPMYLTPLIMRRFYRKIVRDKA